MNASILVGYHVAGIKGALTTVIGTILPPLIIISIISMFYAAFRDNIYVSMAMTGMLAGVAAVICDVVFTMGKEVLSKKKILPLLVLCASFIAVYFMDINIILVILVCGCNRSTECCLRRKKEQRRAAMIYLNYYGVFFRSDCSALAGGYAGNAANQNQVVDVHSWLTMTQFADIMTIAEMTPGPIAINSATFVGIQTAGIPGAIIATIGCVLPSCMIVMTLAYIYYRFRGLNMVQGILAMLRPAVVAMIASACLSLMILSFYGERTLPEDLATIQWIPVLIFAAGFFILRKWKVNPIYVMLGSGAAGVILFSLL